MNLLRSLWCRVAHRGHAVTPRFFVLGYYGKQLQCRKCNRIWDVED